MESLVLYQQEKEQTSDSDAEVGGDNTARKHAKLIPWEKRCLRKILSGGIVHGRRARHITKVEDDMFCKLCDEKALEDVHHMWWKCKAWKKERREALNEYAEEIVGWPECTKCCGIVLRVPELQFKKRKRQFRTQREI